MTEKGVSVVICCHNSAERLPETIKYIALQKVRKEILWEVIIVDNASTDTTVSIAASTWDLFDSKVSFNIKHQPIIGLRNAREMGFDCARYDYVLFCDDDNWLEEKYVETTYDLLSNNDKIGVLGGYGEPVFEHGPPEWMGMLQLFAVGPQGAKSGKVKRHVVYGAGFVIRKTAYNKLLKVKIKSLLSDRMAGTLSSGGDYELCYLIALAGYEVWYHDQLKFKHFLPEFRLTWEYYYKFISESSECFEILEPYKFLVEHKSSSNFFFFFSMVKAILYFTKKFIPTVVNSFRYPQSLLKGKVNKVYYIMYKNRLISYFSKYKIYADNYKKGKEYKAILKRCK